MKLRIRNARRQSETSDFCGHYATAFALEIRSEIDP